jgi:hypothetical protein
MQEVWRVARMTTKQQRITMSYNIYISTEDQSRL